EGRDFQETDTANSLPVAIIDEPLARRYWPDGNALGKRLETTGNQQWMTIVGVVGGVHNESLAEAKQPHIYMPMTQTRPRPPFLSLAQAGRRRRPFQPSETS